MKTLFYVSLVVVAACAYSHNHNYNDEHGGTSADSQQPVVVSPSGEFRGSYNTTRRGRQFESYRGIYYAEPPVGELRFQPPKLILEYKTPVDAREDGPACPLLVRSDYFIDENCLTINVYTPLRKERSKPLPVIFFIHPGGFYSMTGRSDLFGAHYLLDRDVVLVTINYRLGSLDSQQPVVVSPSGEFRGSYNTTRRGRQFESYRGIYYAEPPVGELRFQPPKLILEYKTPVDAREDGPACPLLVRSDYFIDENCLTINVYTPLRKERSKPLPVIFFIHPGGFYSMTGRSDLFGAHYLLDRDVVLVTINYRLGSLGFLSTGDELAPGNNGYKDQVAALKWVQRNIAAFGGDPNSVTIAGCSAGSISVMLHMISPMSKGLFHRGISMSGSPVYKGPTPDNLNHLAVKQAQILNCPTDNSKVIIDCLKTKHWRDIGSSLPGFYEFGFDPVGIWMPIIEKDFGQERFLPIDPVDAIREGKMHAVPHMISQTEDEFFWMAFTVVKNKTLTDQMNAEWERIAPISFMMDRENASYAARRLRTAYLHDKPLKNDAESAKNLGLLYQDSIESFPVHRMANLMCRHSPHPVWYYQFSYIGNHSFYEDSVTKKPVGAAHHDDLIYLFPLSFRFPGISTEGLDSILVDRMTGLWYNFARYGDPNPRGDLPELKGLDWPAMKPEDRKYLRIGDDLNIHKNMKEDRIQVWEELYPIQY